jgi:hypothetical protein
VFVRTYPHSQFGVSGELTSRNTTFEVNMARNDVTQSICPLWASLKEFLKPHRERKTRKSLTDNDRVFQLNAFISGEMALEEIRTKRLVKDITGKNSSLAMMMTHAGNVFTVAPSKNSTLGETVHNSRAAFVVTPDWLGNMGFDSLEELFAAIELAATTELTEITKTRHYGRDKYELDNLIREIKSRKVIEFDDITEGMDDSHVIIPDDKLTKLTKT